MKAKIRLEYYEWPLFKVEPCGEEHVEVTLHEPSITVEAKAIITIKDALAFAKRLTEVATFLKKQERKP